ncbi:putative bifunctional diguanylate cyclase/phosphodiesterase [Polymorphobacter fuscus]|uniref:EAL domain-containing protein n=1 Tax=Sandarakinorhabdus fusca TaxID=1439888 RepID=A0A7C9KZV4_9SPHN|nr:EAL domain-containing protein [Polymorphobacter fuscus]KAB7644073.1 EAL domain-containing protein [Polymorphobacter fuscus]MQT18448.1 EAL domain-containing protein [Polymorphobacter fuscus]NJC08431.1 diguanylate cyclase (GGDEF)-like protein [Polymorphobacter fuscus]
MYRPRLCPNFLKSLSHWKSSDSLIKEQYRALRPQVPTMYLAVLINIILLAFVSSRTVGPDAFIVPIFVAILILCRVIFWWFTRAPDAGPSIAQIRSSMTSTLVTACLVSVGLSIWSEQVLASGGSEPRAYVGLFMALCTICCAACLSSLPLAAYIVVAVGTVPVSISLLLTDDLVLATMGVNMLLVSPLVVGMINRQHKQLRRMVASRSEIAAEQMKASVLAHSDSLTGLANRRAFLDELRVASVSLKRSTLAIAMIDLDGFKLINDTYGHQTGDALLVETAQRLRHLSIGDAVIARLGGDEFAVLLRDIERIDDAQLRLAQLAGVFAQPFRVGDQSFRLKASIGLAHNVTESATTMGLINRADLAMYEAKRRQGATVCLFEPSMEVRTRRRLMIERALANPADSALITLYFQPVIDAATGRISVFEALARWTHPKLGVIPPVEFIPLAEQAGMTTLLTTQLLSMALRTASAWPAHIGLSFNVSAQELASPSIARRILKLVADHGFDPGRLSIEVTETALLSDFAAARTAVCALQEGGVRVLLDDFGAGYASIGYLREMHFDGIKLDGSLITPLMESDTAHDLLVGVLHLCRAIGAPVTAEMVETQAQHDLLCALGVQKLQGYFLSRALPPEEALAACAAGGNALPMPRSSVVLFNKRLPLQLTGNA